MHADRAALNDAADASPRGMLDELADGYRVDGTVSLGATSRLPVDCGDVVDDLRAFDGLRQGRSVAQIAENQLNSFLPQHPGALDVPNKRPDSVSRSRQSAGQVAARESCGAGDEPR
jgi:hypothetical protein